MDFQYSASLPLTTGSSKIRFTDRQTGKQFAARYVLVVNNSDSTNSVFINFVGPIATQGDWEIKPGASTSAGDRFNIPAPGRDSISLISDGTATVRILALG